MARALRPLPQLSLPPSKQIRTTERGGELSSVGDTHVTGPDQHPPSPPSPSTAQGGCCSGARGLVAWDPCAEGNPQHVP